jgi:hypothetical protein
MRAELHKCKGVRRIIAPDPLNLRRDVELLLARHQIDGSVLATAINFDFELEPVAFVKRRHAGAFDGRNVDKRIGLSIIALDEAEAFHRVEEFDSAARFFARQCPLRCATETAAPVARGITVARRAAVRDGHRFAINLEVRCRHFATAIHEREAKRLPFGKARQAGLLDRRDMHEHIFAAVITDNKAEALLPIEKFNDARAFANDLCGHATTGTATTTTTTAAAEATAAAAKTTTAAAESVAATATATEAITAAGKAAAITTAAAAAAAFITEAIAFITSASAAITAATFIETHAVPVLSSKSPACLIQETSCTGRGQNASRRNVIMRHASRDSRKPPMLRAKIARGFI